MRRNRMALDAIAFRPRVLRNVARVDASVELFGRKLRLPVMLAPVGSLEIFDPEGAAPSCAAPARFGAAHMLSSVSEPGLEAVAKAAPDATAHLPALRARRRRLCRRPRQPRHRQRLCRLLPDGRYRALQPARARYRQALCHAGAVACHRRRLPEGAGLAHGQADQGQLQNSAGRSRALRPRKTPRSRSIMASSGSMCPTMAAASSTMAAARWTCCRKSSTPLPAAPRSWSTVVLPRHRHREGDRERRRSGRHRPPAVLGARGGRPSRHRAHAGTAGRRGATLPRAARRHQLRRTRQVLPASGAAGRPSRTCSARSRCSKVEDYRY